MKRTPVVVAVVVLSTAGLIGCKDAPPPLPMVAEGMEHSASAPAASASSAAPAAAPASTAAAAPASPSVFADLPDYPGSTRLQSGPDTKHGTNAIQVKLSTSDTFDNVKKFYQSAIASNGWQVTGTTEKPGEVKWNLAKGPVTGQVEIENEHGALQIKLTRSGQ